MKAFKSAGFAGFATAAGLAGFTLTSPPAKAFCADPTGTGISCSVINPSTSTTITTFGYNDSTFAASTKIFSIKLFANGNGTPAQNQYLFSDGPQTITGARYSLNGGANWTTTGLKASNLWKLGSGSSFEFVQGATSTFAGISTGLLNNFKFEFALAGLGNTATWSGDVNSFGSLSLQILAGTAGTLGSPTSSSLQTRIFTTTSQSVPAPVPLLGAVAALGYSRKLRSRIKLATA